MKKENADLSEVVKKALMQIERMDSKKSLLTIYNNAQNHPTISDNEREVLVEAIELRLREVSPSAAKKIFGGADADARDYLQAAYESAIQKFDFTENRVRNGVKTGGDMISGKVYVDVYTSYKNSEGWHVFLQWIKLDFQAEPFLLVKKYQGGESNLSSFEKWKYSLDQREEAEAKYISLLTDVIE